MSTVTHEDSDSKWNKMCRESTVDVDCVVDVSLVNVARFSGIDKLTLR